MSVVDPRSGKERGMRSEGHGSGTGKAGEPVHDVDEEGVHDSKQGRAGGTPLLKAFPGEDANVMRVHIE
eukprot:10765727-Prorocentrum_lima.AAC.1